MTFQYASYDVTSCELGACDNEIETHFCKTLSIMTLLWSLVLALLFALRLRCESEIGDGDDETNTTSVDDAEAAIDPELETAYLALNQMYASITHGDPRYFNQAIQALSNETLADTLLDEAVMQGIEHNFIHILNTMVPTLISSRSRTHPPCDVCFASTSFPRSPSRYTPHPC